MSLHKFQERGADWLALRRRAYLADDCGLGKTVQDCVAAARANVSSHLVIAPASAIENWHREWAEWGLPGIAFDVMSYADRRIRSVRGAAWDLVTVDEAHYCKSNTAQRTLNVLNIARNAQRSWLLSATPIPNGHAGELWTVLRALWPGIPRRLGINSYGEWRDRFCRWANTERFGPYIYGGKNEHELKPYLNQIILRRTEKTAGIDLPPLRVDVSLLPRDAEFDRALDAFGVNAEDLLRRMEREEKSEDGSASRLRRLLGEYKAPRVTDIIAEELRTNQYKKVVVLAHHRSVLDVVQQKLAKFGLVGFDGSTSHKRRQAAVDEFTNGSPRVFAAQQVAAGIAINLQVSSEVVLIEPSATPSDNWQAIKRINRVGSVRPCRARIFAVAKSKDEATMRVLTERIKGQQALGLSGKGYL